ncbi:MAG: PD-(D/E)XK nuclease family protein [Deltaproteobacteria bacterium]|nr:PD-(D/E)XK nuclease family protein [Deltaproteobacteria bacterium]
MESPLRELYVEMLPLIEAAESDIRELGKKSAMVTDDQEPVQPEFVRRLIAGFEKDEAAILSDKEEAANAFAEQLFSRRGIESLLGKLQNHYLEELGTGASLPELDPSFSEVDAFSLVEWGLEEVPHTKMLTFFLDPKKPHGLGRLPLDYFLTHLLLDETVGRESDIRPLLDVQPTAVKVEPEKWIQGDSRRLDIYMCFDKSNDGKFHVLIEGKVGSQESKNQLADYSKWADRNASPNLKLFLAPKKSTPSEPDWLPVSWNDVRFSFSAMLAHVEAKSPAQQYGLWLCRLWLGTIVHHVLGEENIDYEPYTKKAFGEYGFDELRRMATLKQRIEAINDDLAEGGDR